MQLWFCSDILFLEIAVGDSCIVMILGNGFTKTVFKAVQFLRIDVTGNNS